MCISLFGRSHRRLTIAPPVVQTKKELFLPRYQTKLNNKQATRNHTFRSFCGRSLCLLKQQSQGTGGRSVRLGAHERANRGAADRLVGVIADMCDGATVRTPLKKQPQPHLITKPLASVQSSHNARLVGVLFVRSLFLCIQRGHGFLYSVQSARPPAGFSWTITYYRPP